ncbi:UvrD-helicase domain-containing protein [Eikenella sp. S3360]|uniref:DNA 3'-5' helicase n=1 Tax=Eikenella glucosivorans TaxID=2766967 RepID=A0ABS0NDF1_9NEIS|nr:UvrD-helicase domain-containing protein [Eikenella glucosivorans]MBH5330353.1 UvrD-helicase domain-containing protein [Eikenella glucosivorans]
MSIPQNSLLAGLNPEQLSAVTWPAESALVLAGAGSGKTKVLTTRIAWLLHTGQANLHSVMAVTFTNKAAKEMRARLEAMLPLNIRAMWLGTFHGLCHRFLRLHHKDAGLPASFQILDSSDQLALVKRLLKSLNIAEEIIAPRALQGFINAQKEAGLRAEVLHAGNPYEKRLIECYAEYDRLCRQEGVVDFAELMLRSYEVLSANELLCTHYQNRFSHILVDEFQDTNKLQYDWLKLLAGRHAVVFAVGDDDQSIYRFRGARVGNMADFMREFQVASPIKLEQNYRSVGNILSAANAVIEHNDGRLGKNLRTEAESGEKIRFLSAFTDGEEAGFVVDEIKALHREGMDLEHMAVLYRGNAQSRVLEQALFRAGLPYKIYGGLRFYERQEVKHALAYLRLAVNPEDDNALLRVINVPARGIGSRTVENIQAAAAEEGASLWQAACRVAVKNGKVAAFVHLIEGLRTQIGQLRLPENVSEAVHASGLYEHYQTQKGDHQDRLDNLDELIRAAEEFRPEDSNFETLPADEVSNPAFPVLAFLSNAALESGENQAGANESAVQLMTVHAAKGLEFDAVFLTGMEEGRFPSELSLAEHGGLEEERRLMYVAITRARKRLYISMAQQRMLHGQTHYGTVSRFVEEIPPDLLHLLTPVLKPRFPVPEGVPPRGRSEPQPEWAEPADYGGFSLGQNVRHAKFGTGVIIEGERKADGARLTVNFGKQGIKVLDTKFAKLEAL